MNKPIDLLGAETDKCFIAPDTANKLTAENIVCPCYSYRIPANSLKCPICDLDLQNIKGNKT